jgi:hypothetical protein
MKLTELNKLQTAGTAILTGRFQAYKLETTEKFGSNEKFGVLVGDQVLHFTVWPPKGTKADTIKPPTFADKPGCVVAVIGVNIRVDGKYLRTGADSVHAVEPG